ncbi:hypothetical protein B0T24DRAFT_596574 [Lasiosphaeria ovina]|uniref:Uncharacterized protein n=1 Tax=Lasiosphaeria ovina TaxID=92902 RepID=A0AAE0N1E6_9PEZI|nr:hypothetical protein B0T24DRAFT_596574 [Lasiosphaeria ovina]
MPFTVADHESPNSKNPLLLDSTFMPISMAPSTRARRRQRDAASTFPSLVATATGSAPQLADRKNPGNGGGLRNPDHEPNEAIRLLEIPPTHDPDACGPDGRGLWTPEPDPSDPDTYTIWGRKHFGDDWYERRKTMLQERNIYVYRDLLSDLAPSTGTDFRSPSRSSNGSTDLSGYDTYPPTPTPTDLRSEAMRGPQVPLFSGDPNEWRPHESRWDLVEWRGVHRRIATTLGGRTLEEQYEYSKNSLRGKTRSWYEVEKGNKRCEKEFGGNTEPSMDPTEGPRSFMETDGRNGTTSHFTSATEEHFSPDSQWQNHQGYNTGRYTQTHSIAYVDTR